jgi:hypothetical protein
MTPCSDPLDDEVVWHKLIADYVNHPMNYGTDIHAVGTIALAAGIDPSRAIARTTHSGRSYNSHQLAQLHQGQFLQASGGVGTKVGDLRPPLVFRYSSV